jgi:hypothetical protein
MFLFLMVVRVVHGHWRLHVRQQRTMWRGTVRVVRREVVRRAMRVVRTRRHAMRHTMRHAMWRAV